MAKIYEIRELGAVLRAISGKVRRATARALLRVAVKATTAAKRNARNQFKGTRERPKQGFLLNAIFAGFRMTGSGNSKQIAESAVAVRSKKGRSGTKPYGRIHEYGGTIRPVKANYLWLPLFGPKSTGVVGRFRNMTPRDFVKETKRNARGKTGFKYRGKKAKGKRPRERTMKGEFAIIPSAGGQPLASFIQHQGRGKSAKTLITPLFLLRQKVEMPARPYVTPAVTAEFANFKAVLDFELNRGKKTTTGDTTPKNQG